MLNKSKRHCVILTIAKRMDDYALLQIHGGKSRLRYTKQVSTCALKELTNICEFRHFVEQKDNTCAIYDCTLWEWDTWMRGESWLTITDL